MLVFMVGSSSVLVFLSGDHAWFVPVPQRGQKNPAQGGAVTEQWPHPASMRAKAPIGLEITGTAHIEVPTLKRAFTQEIEFVCAQRVVLIHSASTPCLTWQ
jgi:hypothetical protein